MHGSLIRITIAAVGLLGCGKADEKSGSAPSATPATSVAQAAPVPTGKVGPGRIQLPGLGISVDVPRPVSMRTGRTDQGKPRLSVDLGDFRVDFVSGADVTPDLAATKAALQAATNPMQKVTQETVTERGWHLEYEAAGSVDKNKLHGVDVRATFAGTPYQCSAIARDRDDAKMYAAVCDSMQKP